MRSKYKYVEDFNSNIATLEERDKAIASFREDAEEGLVDTELLSYLEMFFDSHALVPIFSCAGHCFKPGYILFRSMYDVEKTLSIFKPVLLTYDIIEDISLRIHYWNSTSIGYCFYFNKEYLDRLMPFLLKQSYFETRDTI